MLVPAPLTDDLARAQHLLDRGRFAHAETILSRVLATDPDNVRAWCLISWAQIAQERPRAGLESAQRAIALRPDDDLPHRLASVAYGEQGKWRKSIAPAREAVRLAPYSAVAHAQLATAIANGRPPGFRREATRVARRAVELSPESPDVLFMVGNVSYKRRRFRQATAYYRRVLEIEPENTGALNNLSLIQARGWGLIDATSGLGQAAALSPENDLHRRNIDAVFSRHLRRLRWIVLFCLLLLALNPRLGLVALIVPAGLIVLAVRAHRRLSPGTWAYVSRLPLTNAGAAIQSLMLGFIVVVIVGGAVVPSERQQLFVVGWFAFFATGWLSRLVRVAPRRN